MYQAAFEQSPIGEYLLSAADDPIILAVNDAFLRTVQRVREDLVGHRLFEVFPGKPDDTEDTGVFALRASLKRVIDRRVPDQLPRQRYPIAVLQADGTELFEERFWNAISSPVFGAEGVMLCISHRTEDVTVHAHAEQALRRADVRAEAALRIARMGTFTWSVKSGRVECSDRTREIFGWNEHEGFCSDDFFQRMDPADVPGVRAIIGASLAGDGYVEQSFRIRLPGGAVRHVKSMAISERDADGDWAHHTGVAIDVTEQTQREQELQMANGRKDEYLAMLAHELRNPLAPISAAAELLARKPDDSSLVKKASLIIARQVRHMAGLIHDLMDVSRVTRGHVSLDLAEIDAHDVVAAAIEQARPLIDARSQQLTVHPSSLPATVLIDSARMVQVFTNLLTNAARYTPQGGRIAVKIAVDEQLVQLCVSDSGDGMPEELLQHCFKLFVQNERSSDRSAGGLGIGLALVKSLVELHGGHVRAESEGVGKGSRFTVTLPRIAAPRTTEAAPPIRTGDRVADANRLKVLIVDDNKDAADSLALLVEMIGHEPMVAHDPQSALNQINADPPDLCFLDLGLPDMNGYQLAEAILRAVAPASVTLIAVSGYGQPQDRSRALASGFATHLVKPVDAICVEQLLAAASTRQAGLKS